jgi:Mg2+-importing ATPase
VFARVTPEQKARLVTLLRRHGRAVGFLGDGVNDALALHAADIGISVDTAADVAKDAADVILLQKDLNVLADGIAEGKNRGVKVSDFVAEDGDGAEGEATEAAGAAEPAGDGAAAEAAAEPAAAEAETAPAGAAPAASEAKDE